ncbi:nucleoside phosphorylase domain-containing protein [Aspergillus undulatus]|uniref:nucleoside phosphorylase domain-containing protein n=1 Tax=Aspergillus undulatus TaxID=1810928 RepID=UPI003CCDC60B
MTKAWNEDMSTMSQSQNPSFPQWIRPVSEWRPPIWRPHPHRLHMPQPAIVVKLIPDWCKVSTLFLTMLGFGVVTEIIRTQAGNLMIFLLLSLIVLVAIVQYIPWLLEGGLEVEDVRQDLGLREKAGDPHNRMILSRSLDDSRSHTVRTAKSHKAPIVGGATQIDPGNIRRRILRHEDYTVGWISALSVEMAAASAMLDVVHPELPAPESDDNVYILGRMSSHNVVIACLPAGLTGAVPAAIAAARMRSTFPSIRFGLLVGIGGGVPSLADICLGDVVVGVPTSRSNSRAIVQCSIDSGYTSMLNRPPDMLLNAVNKLKSKHYISGNGIQETLSKMVERQPSMGDKFTTTERDQLFHAAYKHSSPCSLCNYCDQRNVIMRNQRNDGSPQIHYGLIASVDQVVKDGMTRDRLAQQHGNICFEMEAGGLVDTFACLVIRGISDYADSHKNDHWQGRASVTAAAYAKELLSVIPAGNVEH